MFYTTQIPVCLWFVRREKRARRGEVLFVDARKLGTMISRTQRELTHEVIARSAATYHAWLGGGAEPNADQPGFCASATLNQVRAHGHVLTPGRYVGAEEAEDEDEPFDEKMARLVEKLEEQFAESEQLTGTIREMLVELGYARGRFT